MSDTPKVDAVLNALRDERGVYDELDRIYALARALERINASLKKELAEVTEAFQKECDHEFVKQDHSFDHAFGCEVIRFLQCEKCGKTAEWDDVPDDDSDPPERDEPDYDAPRPLTPLENHERNDEHNVR